VVLPDGTEYHALIFDWDGTLVDSQAINFGALASALAAHGVTMTADWYWQRVGTSGAELIAELGREQSPNVHLPVDEIVSNCLAAIRSNVHKIEVNQIVADVARRASGRQPLAVASGGSREVVVPALEHTGLRELFRVVVTGEDARRGKPAPDLFLLAADQLGVAPQRCLVYEDSAEGIQAARSAGMAVVDVSPFLRSPAK
jgi:beta-phosphoglucomutase-like phosphatase (HAD superfamily)